MRLGLVASGAFVIACASGSLQRAAERAAPAVARLAPEPAAPFPEISSFRLPHTFEPRSYRASLSLGDGRFTGRVEISGELAEATSLVWLHGVDLVVTRATAVQGEVTVPLEFSQPRSDQLLGFRSKTPLAPGRWTLAIEYGGPIREQEPPLQHPRWRGNADRPALGIFRRAVGANTYVFTHSEPIYARRIFPCIDEPDRKVPWQLSLEVRKDLVAASNTTAVREVSLGNNRKRVEFAETPPLPSYLIAFAVGPFEVIEAQKRKSETPIRVLAIRGRGAAVAAATNNTPRILDQLEAWFEIPYPYGKLDLVAVPHSGWGAMENPGLITFDQSALEAEDNTSIISHELAHQWFGNYVTLRWWDDIWLNESFATFMADKIERNVLDSTGAQTLAPQRIEAMFWFTHGLPVRRSVATIGALELETFAPWESIHRGVAALKMIEAHVGTEAFRRAMTLYLASHAHGSVTTDDFIRVISAIAKRPLDGAVDALLDGELPSLEATVHCDKRQGSVQFANVPRSIPVCVAYDRDGTRAEVCASIDSERPRIELPARSCPRWIMPNAHGAGIYRIVWTKQLVDPLLAKGWASLTLPERQTIFGELENTELRLSIFIKRVTSGAESVLSEPSFLRGVAKYVSEDLRPRFDAWVRSKYGARARSTHFREGEPHSKSAQWELFRIVELVAVAQDPHLAKEAAPLAATYQNHPQGYWPRDGYTRSVLTVAANADSKFAASLLDDLEKPDPSGSGRRHDVIAALSDVRDIAILVMNDPSKFHPWELNELLANTCDTASRTEIAKLPEGNPVRRMALASIDRCIATRKRLDPMFRAWLRTVATR